MALELFTPQESRPAPKVQAPDPYEVARSAYANQKERLIETQRMLMEELEGRSVQPAEKLMAFSQAMLTPGRTGSFGEAFGGAMGNLQKLQSEDAARAQAIAKMRMEMGMQQLGMAKEDIELAKQTQAMKLVSSVFGASPQQTAAALQAGTVPGGDFSRVTPELYMRVQQLDPKLAEGLKNAFGMDVERRKIVNDDIKNGMQLAELISKHGENVVRYLPKGMATPGVQPEAGSVNSGPPLTDKERYTANSEAQALEMAQKMLKEGKRFNVEYSGDKLPVGTPVPSTQAAQASATRAPEPTEEESRLPLQTRNEIIARRIAEAEKETQPQRDAIMAANPSVTSAKDRSLRELIKLIDDNKRNVERGGVDIFGVMQKQGVLSAIYNAAQEGIRAGTLSVSFPADTVLRSLNIPENLRPMMTRVTQILGEQFLLNARANRGVLGTNPTNFDARLMQAPMADINQSSSAVEYWAKMNVLSNKEREETYNAYNKFPAQQKHKFFTSPEYENIVKKYTDYNNQFVKKYSPGYDIQPPPKPKSFLNWVNESMRGAITP